MNKTYNVKNRSSNKVIYRIPEMGIRREFMPGESKQISHDELKYINTGEALIKLEEDILC